MMSNENTAQTTTPIIKTNRILSVLDLKYRKYNKITINGI